MLAEAPFNAITHEIISAAIEVHRILGPGLLESTYTRCLHRELSIRRITFVTEQRVPVVYKGVSLDALYLPVHQAQVLTYLFLTELPVGLVINFNVARLVVA